MEAVVERVGRSWACRLPEVKMQRLFHYKSDAVGLQKILLPMPRYKVEGTYTLHDGHYFHSYQ